MSALHLLHLVDSASDHGEILARHYKTGEGTRVTWKDGRIVSVEPASIPADAPWIAPALVDVQVNGYAGIDFQADSTDEESLLKVVRALRRDGCARVLLTVITRNWPCLLENLKRLKTIRDGNPELARTLFGWHVEGPFISGEPGFIGAHPPDAVCDPSEEAISELKAVVGNDPTLLTLAPERTGSEAAIRKARELGFVVSLGHTNASKAEVKSAVQAGAQGFTHLGNGCPQQLDRHDNILWRVLDDSGLTAGLIPDTHHVNPQVFRLFHKLLPEEKISWTTDAMSGAGAPPGLYSIGRLQVEVGEDRVARQPGKQNFAGSALEPLRGITLGAGMLGKPWQSVWDHFSVIPSRLMGQNVSLEPGGEAAFCLLKEGI